MNTGYINNKNKMFSTKALFALILPLIIEQLLNVTIGLADTVMVATAGENAVSGISLVDSINNLIITLLSALATGGAVVSSQYVGNNKLSHACRAAKQLIYVSTLTAAVISIVFLTFRGGILRLIFGAINSEVMNNCISYMFLSALSYPFIALYSSGAAICRSMGNSKISMIISLAANITNIIGNAIFIYGFDLGVIGAGTASLISRIISAVIITVIICKKKLPVHIQAPAKFEFEPDMIKRILRIGIPGGLESSSFHIGKLIVLSLVATLGTASIAANAVSNTICSFSNVPGTAIGLAIVTVVGQCLGAGKKDEAVYYAKLLIATTYIIMGIIDVFIFIFSGDLAAIFGLSSQTAELTEQVISMFAIVSILIWPLSFTIPNALRSSGDIKYVMVSSMASMWIFRVGLSYILVLGLGMGLTGVWISMYIDWICRSVLFVWRFWSRKWLDKKVIS